MLWFLSAVLAIQAPDEVRVSSRAYVPQSPYTLRVDTKLVAIEATVRDHRGKAVQGLAREDFRVLDDGKTRVIDQFSVSATAPATNAPGARTGPEALKTEVPATSAAPARYLALFIDDVNGKDEALAGDLIRTQTAAAKFVREALQPGVRIAIFTASGAPNVDFTTDEAKLTEAIAALKAHVKLSEGGLTACPRVTPYLAMRIAYNRDPAALRASMADAGQKNCPVSRMEVVTQAEETWRRVKEISTDTFNYIGRVVDHLGNMPGRRELLIASSGFLAVTMQSQKEKVIDHALRAGVVISALDSKGLYSENLPGSRPQDAVGYKPGFAEWSKSETIDLPIRLQTLNEPMANLAEATGGIFYHNNNDLAAGFRELGLPPEVVYRIGFRPEGVALDGGYHKLKVSAKGFLVQVRPGYFAPTENESFQSKIDREMLADDNRAEFPARIAVQQLKTEFSVIVMVDISKLRFVKKDDRQVQKIAFVTGLVDAQGKLAAAKEGVMELALTEATYKRLASTGVNAKVTFQVPAGVYKLRQVAEESVEGKIACSSHTVQVQ